MQVATLAGRAATAPAARPHAPSGPTCPLPQEVWTPAEIYAPLSAPDNRILQDALASSRAAQARPYYDAAADGKDAAAYYGDLTAQAATLSPDDLYRRLSDLITRTHTQVLNYAPSKYLYPVVDLHPDGKLHSVYSGRPLDLEETVRRDLLAHRQHHQQRWALLSATTLNAAQVGERIASLDANLAYNCEHVVPQAWFDKQLPERGDLHHLFACDPGCNNLRGDLPYTSDPQGAGPDPGGCGTVTPDHRHFIPGDGPGRGEVARATLYFLLRYPGVIGGKPDEYQPSDIKTLLDWNRAYPVTDYERHRNAEIFHLQGNRNPLIDHPEWADKIDFALGDASPAQA